MDIIELLYLGHIIPLNEFMILDQDYKINVFKLEEMKNFKILKSKV